MFPDFYLVGAPKAGTSFLYHCFRDHPQVFCPEVKESHHFSFPEVTRTYYDVVFVESQEEYLDMYSNATKDQLCGDYSPSYLASEHAAFRIHDVRPDAKIIMILRDPTERAISHYLMDVRLGYQPYSLSEILSAPEEHPLYFKEYVEVGRYAEHVERFTEQFPKQSILVARYEDFKKSNREFVDLMTAFLGIDSIQSIPTVQHNSHVAYRSGILKAIAESPLKVLASNMLPQTIKDRMRASITTKEKPSFAEERTKLNELFRHDVNCLNELIDIDTSSWLKST